MTQPNPLKPFKYLLIALVVVTLLGLTMALKFMGYNLIHSANRDNAVGGWILLVGWYSFIFTSIWSASIAITNRVNKEITHGLQTPTD